MGRPKASPEQQVLAREFHLQGMKSKAIAIELEREFLQPVSLSTVEKWCRAFRDNPIGDALLDTQFKWEQMDKAGIPWESGEYLLSVWKWLTEDKNLIPPTFRHMRWWWRVHLASPNLGHEDTLKLVIDAESDEYGVQGQEELTITRQLAALKSGRGPIAKKGRFGEMLLRVRENNSQHTYSDHLKNIRRKQE